MPFDTLVWNLYGNNPLNQFRSEDTKEVIRSRKSKDRQCNGQKKRKTKRTNNDLQTIYRATRTPLKPGVNLGPPEGTAVPAPHVTSDALLLSYTNITVCNVFGEFHVPCMLK